MPVYDFQCPKCEKIQEITMSMKDVGIKDVYCKGCNPHIDEWVMLSFLDKEELQQLNLVKMHRYYKQGNLPNGFVKGNTLGSLMGTQKFKAKNYRPDDWFIEEREKKRDANDKLKEVEGPTRTIKIKDTPDE